MRTPKRQELTLQEINLLEQLAIYEARASFWAYRQYMRPDMVLGWWQRLIAHELQQFYEDFVAGKRPKLLIETPPQHGKTESVTDWVGWVVGQCPSLRVIYASFSDRLGIRANLQVQRAISQPIYAKIFPGTKIGGNYTQNRQMVEFMAENGQFRNTTIRGPINGEGLDIGIIDDPLKGRGEAKSKAQRDHVWDWFTDDFFGRFSANGAMIAICTRWHVDDPLGRFQALFGDEVKVISYPAIATEDEEYRKAGEALFPELKPLDFLLERKRVMSSASWEAQYQQNPQVIGGEVIKTDWFGSYKVPPIIKQRNIYADTAQKTAERNDFSVFQCWGLGDDGRLYLLDMIRGKWEAPELKRRALAFWRKHAALDRVQFGALRALKIEDKASGTGLIQDLRLSGSVPVLGIGRQTDKYTRLLDVLGYIESGYVILPEESPYLADFLAECEAFSADGGHLHDDQIDPMIDAINDMLTPTNQRRVWDNLI